MLQYGVRFTTMVFLSATFKCHCFFVYHKKSYSFLYKYFCKQLHNSKIISIFEG